MINKLIMPGNSITKRRSTGSQSSNSLFSSQSPFSLNILKPSLPKETPIKRRQKGENGLMTPEHFDRLVELKLRALNQEGPKGGQIGALPVMASLKAEPHVSETRMGVDIVLLIDVSGSMEDDKLKFVQKTVEFVIDNLEDCDRLALVQFNDKAEVLSNLTAIEEIARKRLKGVNNSLTARGSTNIVAGLRTAIDLLTQRKEVNDISAIFLLSDGDDTCGNKLPAFKAFFAQLDLQPSQNNYQIHSFGYGDDHNEEILCMISDRKQGKFYNIVTLSKVEDCFIACLGTLLSCLAQNFKIELTPAKGVSVTKTFGPLFGPTANRPLTINVGSFSSDTERDFVLITKIESLPNDVEEVVIIEAKVTCSIDDRTFSKTAVLTLKLVSDPSLIGQPCKIVEENLLRVEAAELIKEAEMDINNGDISQAETKVKSYQARVERTEIDSIAKEKMTKMVNLDLLKNKKEMKSLARDLNDQSFNPESKAETKINFAQERLMKKKK